MNARFERKSFVRNMKPLRQSAYTGSLLAGPWSLVTGWPGAAYFAEVQITPASATPINEYLGVTDVQRCSTR